MFTLTEDNLFGREVVHKYDERGAALQAVQRLFGIYGDCQFTLYEWFVDNISQVHYLFKHDTTGEKRSIVVGFEPEEYDGN